jgi:hypothetical protein
MERISAEKNVSVKEAAEILEKKRKNNKEIDTSYKLTKSLKKLKVEEKRLKEKKKEKDSSSSKKKKKKKKK